MKLFKNRYLWALIIFVSAGILQITPASPKSTVYAQPTEGRWIDAAHIEYDGRIFTKNRADQNDKYSISGNEPGCEDYIDISGRNWRFAAPDSSGSYNNVNYISKVQNTSTSDCDEQNPVSITLNQTENSQISFRWLNASEITSVWGSYEVDRVAFDPTVKLSDIGNFILDESDNLYKLQFEEVCASQLSINDTTGRITEADFIGRHLTAGGGFGTCETLVEATFSVKIADAENRINNTGGSTTATPASGTTGRECEDADGVEMSWLLCPILRGVDSFTGTLDRYLSSILRIPNEYFTGEAGANLQNAWRSLRNIAYFALVPVLLFMVISTALGFEFFSAYTIKRALPRFIIATIFIALSFEILRLAIVIVNDIGNGLSGLVYNAFGSSDTITLSTLFQPDHADSAGAGTIAGATAGLTLMFTGIGAGGGFAAAMGIILGYGLMAVIALLIGFLLLVGRQLILIFLLILAPLAILTWIFPGNDKPWNLWKNSFIALLLLYPLIAIMVATGKSFALLIDQATAGVGSVNVPTSLEDARIGLDGVIYNGMKLIAYLAPYFLIPSAFKYAGGAFSSLAGMVNNKEKGIFDRTRNRAKRPWQEQRGIDKKLQEQSRLSKYQKHRYKQLGDQGTGAKGFYRRNIRDSGISAETARLARAEHSKNELQQASFAAESGGINVADREFIIQDHKGKVINAKGGKDEALVQAALGGKVMSLDGKTTLFEGDTASQRAAVQILGQQGNVGKMREVKSALNNPANFRNESHQTETIEAFSEGVQSNVSSIMPKAPDLIKGDSALNDWKPDEVVGWDKSTIEAAINQAGGLPAGNERNAAWATIASSLDQISRNPELQKKMSGANVSKVRSTLDRRSNAPLKSYLSGIEGNYNPDGAIY